MRLTAVLLALAAAPFGLAIPRAESLAEAAPLPAARPDIKLAPGQKKFTAGRQTPLLGRKNTDKRACESNRQSAVHECEVRPRGGVCASLVGGWHDCVKKTYGWDLGPIGGYKTTGP